MKKLLSIAVASFAVAALAEPFSPTIGVTQVPLTLKNTVLPVQFNSLADGGNISVTDLVCTNGLTVGEDILYVFEEDKYTGWLLTEAGWTKADIQTPTGPQGSSVGKVASGGAIWISLQRTPAENQSVFIYGKVATVTNTTIVGGTSAAPKYNLVCNPTGVNVSYDTLTNKLSSIAKNGDTISPLVGTFQGNFVYNENTKLWTYVGLYEGNTVVSTDITTPFYANAGFWYVSKGGAGSISW